MDWTIKSYEDANHPPVAVVHGALERTVKPGEEVELDATGSSDPDGGRLAYKWWVYEEAGSHKGSVDISDATSATARFEAPTVASSQTLHVILEVRDDGEPALVRYGRVIVTVAP